MYNSYLCFVGHNFAKIKLASDITYLSVILEINFPYFFNKWSIMTIHIDKIGESNDACKIMHITVFEVINIDKT